MVTPRILTSVVDEPTLRKCEKCGELIDARAFVCIHCGYDIRVGWTLAIVGGCLAISAGALSYPFWPTAFLATTSILAIVGGAFTLCRRGFPIAVAGGLGAALGLGFYLGVPALVMIILARRSFRPLGLGRKR